MTLRPGAFGTFEPPTSASTYTAYRSAITRTASADYSREQIAAWVGLELSDLSEWKARREAACAFVAAVDEDVVGFTDLVVAPNPQGRTEDGLLDMLFVHHDYAGRGIARQLVETVKREAAKAGLPLVRTFASRTAKPVFERFGFRVIIVRPDNTIRGRTVPNFEMAYDLIGASSAARPGP